ncbi:MAG: hypothetical protein AAF677_06885 [Pseudomonadota bacterium]
MGKIAVPDPRPLAFEDAVRRRPGMYLGAPGLQRWFALVGEALRAGQGLVALVNGDGPAPHVELTWQVDADQVALGFAWSWSPGDGPGARAALGPGAMPQGPALGHPVAEPLAVIAAASLGFGCRASVRGTKIVAVSSGGRLERTVLVWRRRPRPGRQCLAIRFRRDPAIADSTGFSPAAACGFMAGVQRHFRGLLPDPDPCAALAAAANRNGTHDHG